MAKFKQQIDEKSAALSLGLLFGLLHAIGIAAIQAGGQGLIKWIQDMHFVSKSVTVLPFNITTAVVGIVAAFVVGAIVGWLFATIWNRAVKRK